MISPTKETVAEIIYSHTNTDTFITMKDLISLFNFYEQDKNNIKELEDYELNDKIIQLTNLIPSLKDDKISFMHPLRIRDKYFNILFELFILLIKNNRLRIDKYDRNSNLRLYKHHANEFHDDKYSFGINPSYTSPVLYTLDYDYYIFKKNTVQKIIVHLYVTQNEEIAGNLDFKAISNRDFGIKFYRDKFSIGM